MKSMSHNRRVIALMLGSLLILGACGSLTGMLQGAAPTASPNPVPGSSIPLRAFVCDEVKVIHYHLGKITADGMSDLTQADVQAALQQRDWTGALRHIVGDTDDTILRTKLNNAAIEALCTPSK